MNSDFTLRTKIGIYTLAAMALLTGLIALKDEGGRSSASAESNIGFFDERFGRLADKLPSSGVVGYLSDQPFGDHQSTAEYYLAQYALAPVVVISNTDRRLVVGNFIHAAGSAQSIAAGRGLDPVADLGDGIWLLRNPGQ
jgi:hypothetical protein